MRPSNVNLVEAIGGNEIEWLSGSRWTSHPNTKMLTHSPALLVVDDEPAFDQKLIQVARKSGVKATACQSIIEARALFSHSPYDVAIVNDELGEFSRNELCSLFEKSIPLILIASDKRARELERNFPYVLRKVVTKKEGAEAIVAHALRAMHVATVSSEYLGTLEKPTFLPNRNKRWLVLTALLLALSLALIASVLRKGSALSNHSIDRWDKLSIEAKVGIT